MLKKMIGRVLFGRRRKKNYYEKYVTWHAHNKLQAKMDNLLRHLKLQSIGNHSLIGDAKDAKKFRDQFDY